MQDRREGDKNRAALRSSQIKPWLRLFAARALITTAALAVFGASLALPAIHGVVEDSIGVGFEKDYYRGFTCLLLGWTFPTAWLANPIFFLTLILFLLRAKIGTKCVSN